MNDQRPDRHLITPTPRSPALGRTRLGLSIVVPVYRGAATVGRWCDALAALHPAGGLEIVLVNDGSPDNSAEVCRALLATRHGADHLYRARPQFRRAQRGHDRAAPRRGAYVITMDDDLQNPPEEVVRLYDHARAGRLGRGLHPLRGEAARRLAQPRQPLRQRGRRRAAGQAERALSLVVPLHVGAGGAGGRPATAARIPMSTG